MATEKMMQEDPLYVCEFWSQSYGSISLGDVDRGVKPWVWAEARRDSRTLPAGVSSSS